MAKRSVKEVTFLVLTSLAAGSQHGYGILPDVADISEGRVRLRAGMLYSALDRLRRLAAVRALAAQTLPFTMPTTEDPV